MLAFARDAGRQLRKLKASSGCPSVAKATNPIAAPGRTNEEGTELFPCRMPRLRHTHGFSYANLDANDE